jgi:hypothetical protein
MAIKGGEGEWGGIYPRSYELTNVCIIERERFSERMKEKHESRGTGDDAQRNIRKQDKHTSPLNFALFL